MIKTASLENSKRLYKLAPEWNDTHFVYNGDGFIVERYIFTANGVDTIKLVFAPDLDWLLDKLPSRHYVANKIETITGTSYYEVTIRSINGTKGQKIDFLARADTPADAACLLLIKLLEQGIVKV